MRATIIALALGAAPPLTSGSPKIMKRGRGATGSLDRGTEPMVMSSTGQGNPLPAFLFMAGSSEGGLSAFTSGYQGGTGKPNPFITPNDCPDDLFGNGWWEPMPDLRDQVMPYLELDDFGCERVPSNASVLVLENDYLRAAITPSYGGKVWSLYDKKHDKQLVYNNPAHQPSSIALRQAWTAGGIEWNWAPGRIGHSVFSEQAVFAAKIPTPRGDVARVWEFVSAETVGLGR